MGFTFAFIGTNLEKPKLVMKSCPEVLPSIDFFLEKNVSE